MLRRALACFCSNLDIKITIIAVAPDMRILAESQIADLKTPFPIRFCDGGVTRFDSVRNAFQVVGHVDHVWIHDAARPNVSPAMQVRLREASLIHGAVIPVLSVTDTIKVVRDGVVTSTLNRSELAAVQTPQVFWRDWLAKAYTKAKDLPVTDEATLLESAGYRVQVVMGDIENIKVTTPLDSILLEALLNLG